MANYIIIGGDQKEYGPITGNDVRQWIAEGRLNAESLAKAESDAEFRPLSAFPELADAFAPQTAALKMATPGTLSPVSAATGADETREAALRRIKAPALALVIISSLGCAYYLFSGVVTLLHLNAFHQEIPPEIPPQMRAFIEGMQGPMAGFINLLVASLNAFVIYGAVNMMRLKKYTVAFTACVVAMLPCQCCCLLGLPFGIWALVILNKTEMKKWFV